MDVTSSDLILTLLLQFLAMDFQALTQILMIAMVEDAAMAEEDAEEETVEA